MEMLLFFIGICCALTLVYGQTCLEIEKCQYDMKRYADAQAHGDIPTLCNLLGKTVECMEIALEDCEKNANYRSDLLMQARQGLEMNKEQVNAFCPGSDRSSVASGSGSAGEIGHSSSSDDIPEQASCTEIMACMFDVAQFQNAMNQNRLTEACGLINPSVKCLRSAIKDCKDRQVMDSNDLARATQSLQDSEKLLQAHCGYTVDDKSKKPAASSEDGQSSGQSSGGKQGSTAGAGDKNKSGNMESNYHTVNDGSNSNTVHVDSDRQGDGGNDGASTNITSLSFLVALLVLSIGNLFCDYDV